MPLNTELILAELKRRKKTQAWLAAKANIPTPNLSYILRGRDARMSTIDRIAAAIGMPASKIVR